MTAAAVRCLDVARARKLTDQLRASLDVAVELLTEAYAGEAWRALGYASWSAYTRAELPQLAVLIKGLPVEQRRGAVGALRAAGMSLRAAAEVSGLSPNTVRTDAAAAGVQLAEVISLDGSRRAPAAGPGVKRRRAVPTTDRVVTLLAGNPGGLTARDVSRELHLPRHLAAPALTRLTQAGRIVYRPGAARGQFGRYSTS